MQLAQMDKIPIRTENPKPVMESTIVPIAHLQLEVIRDRERVVHILFKRIKEISIIFL